MKLSTLATVATIAIGMVPAFRAAADTLDVEGGTIYYETLGSGMPIMVMHGGLGLDHTYLRPYFDQLADLGQVVYYDHRGNGKSSRPDDFSTLSFEVLVQDAEALRAHLGQDKMILIGHSYGGFVALEYAMRHSDHLAGLVLVNTVPVFDYAPSLNGSEEQMAALGKLFSQPMVDDDDMRATWNTVIPMYFKTFDAEIGARLDQATTYSAAAWNQAGGMLAKYNTLEGLAGIDAPTLAVGGAADGITPSGPGAERIAAGIPGADLMVFENSGHYPFIEEEAAFFAGLREWIGGL